MVEIECGGFVFTSNFESGNMARVEQVLLPPKPPPLPGQSTSSSDTPDYEFNIWTNPDCAGTEFENSNRSWFYFGIRGGTPFALVKLNLVNLNRQVKMYSQGMAPVFRILPGRGLWDRIREKPAYSIEDNVFTLSFRYRTLENVRATTYFAFTFPYSYQDLMMSLRGFDKRFKSSPPPERYFPGQSVGFNADDIYYHREVATYSLDGRRLDLLTITSHHGITPDLEPRLKNLFPDLQTPRPHIFVGKKVVFVSARVHPGEVPSSYVLNGLLESLLNRDDLTSILLRRMYVFKIIPMLNPDGVARGHFRTDTRGVNLNRVYLNPSLVYHPTIYAARAIIRYAHFGIEVDDSSAQLEPAEQSQLGAMETAQVGNDVNIMCQDAKQSLPSVSNLLLTEENSIEQKQHASQALEELPDVPGGVCISLEGNSNTIQNTILSQTDEEMTNSDDATVSQENSDPIEMEVEKEKSMNIEKDVPVSTKDPFCVGFPTDILEYAPIDDERNNSGSLRSRGGVEICPDRENMESILESSEADTLHGDENHTVSCDESAGLEVVKKSHEPKCKPPSTGASKPGRLCSRPVSQSEEDGKDDESLFTTCNSNNLMNACWNAVKPSLDSSKSGLFLYMDMHGHASKKGIFMYGNHFDDTEQLVECMLLPKIMSINSQNFHFTACNFTERNMYLRDRRDGMSREGCGRVSVLKMTGLVRSYTLECNYNTGRMVNLLPPCVRDSGRMSVNPAYAVPPKYTPLVFEEVGRALGVSILDLTSSNPCSRIPNSDYRSVNGIREWLRSNCLSDSQLWTRMLHRPTRPQVGQSASSHSVAGPSTHKPVHLTKSVLLARISTELKTLGEEYARKEHLRMQKTVSCSQLDTIEAISVQPPKENIGPGQCSSRSRRVSEATSSQAKASHSGILQQRAKTLTVANLPSTSRKKLKSSAAAGTGPLRPVSKSKVLRRAKTHDSSAQSSSSSGDSVPFVFDESENAEVEVKTSPSMELCATPKRLKVSGKAAGGKLLRKQAAWTVKPTEVVEKTETCTETSHFPWTAIRNPQSLAFSKKSAICGKLEKTSRLEVSKIRPSVLNKVKAVKKLSQSDSSNLGDNAQAKFDQPHSLIRLTERPSGVKSTKLSNVEINKPNSGAPVCKDWIRSKSSSRNLLFKADIAVPGPSSAEPGGCEGNGSAAASSAKIEQKLKSTVLRSLEKGSKSRLLCPVRRRSSDGKKTRKNVDRKPSSTENNSNTSSTSILRSDALNNDNFVN